MATDAQRAVVWAKWLSAGHPMDPLRERTAALFEEHSRYVWSVLRRMGVAEVDVEDVCQDVFLIAHRKLNEFEERSSSRTWIYGICLRVAANYRRVGHRRREQLWAAVPEQSTAMSEQALLLSELDRALGRLSDAKRAVFVLHEFAELSMVEISEVVGSPIKTCFSRLHAARRELRSLLGAQSEHP